MAWGSSPSALKTSATAGFCFLYALFKATNHSVFLLLLTTIGLLYRLWESIRIYFEPMQN